MLTAGCGPSHAKAAHEAKISEQLERQSPRGQRGGYGKIGGGYVAQGSPGTRCYRLLPLIEARVTRRSSRLDFQLRPVEDHDPASPQPERPTPLFFPKDSVQRRPGRPGELRQLLLGEIDLYDPRSPVV
jgi:hypothetical protein